MCSEAAPEADAMAYRTPKCPAKSSSSAATGPPPGMELRYCTSLRERCSAATTASISPSPTAGHSGIGRVTAGSPPSSASSPLIVTIAALPYPPAPLWSPRCGGGTRQLAPLRRADGMSPPPSPWRWAGRRHRLSPPPSRRGGLGWGPVLPPGRATYPPTGTSRTPCRASDPPRAALP